MTDDKAVMAPSRSFRARVLENAAVKGDHRLLVFSPLTETAGARPGQFYMLGTGPGVEPLLKRPFCFFGQEGNRISVLYRVCGKGTERLAHVGAGEELSLLGPLGNSYPLPGAKRTPLVVAGGTAIASVLPLIRKLNRRAVVVYGAGSEGGLVMTEELRSVAGELHLCTEDGSSGRKGTVLDVIGDMETGKDHVLYACGPRAMTQAVAGFAAERALTGYVSLEEYMACGIGACMGCVVLTRKGYRRVCREGPIFKLEEIMP